MSAKKRWIVLLFVMALASCASPHALPDAPTPIPRLIPATLPPGGEPVMEPTAGEPGPASDSAAAADAVGEGSCGACHIIPGIPESCN